MHPIISMTMFLYCKYINIIICELIQTKSNLKRYKLYIINRSYASVKKPMPDTIQAWLKKNLSQLLYIYMYRKSERIKQTLTWNQPNLALSNLASASRFFCLHSSSLPSLPSSTIVSLIGSIILLFQPFYIYHISYGICNVFKKFFF